MKIYTQTGDQGRTSLPSGERVSKSNLRVQACGEVDELNSVLGLLAAGMPADTGTAAAQLQDIQSDLLRVGALLAAGSDPEAAARLKPFGDPSSLRLESWVDAMQAALPELKAFILPGGHRAAAQAHVARAVCRRAERAVVTLAESLGRDGGDAGMLSIQAYMNRLSDYLFVLARYINQRTGAADTVWQG